MTNNPLVSIIIPCHNQGHFISQAIESALAQTYQNIEVVVVNDGSTDNTRKVMESYGEQIQYIEKENGGPSSARNSGVLGSSGEWLQFLDADDIITSNKIEKQALGGLPSYVGCVYSGWRDVHVCGEIMASCFPKVPSDFVKAFLTGNMLTPSAILIRRTAFESAGGFDEGLKGFEDWDLWFRIALDGWRFVSVDGIYTIHRIHENNLSGNSESMLEQSLLLLDKMEGIVRRNSEHVQIVKDTRSRTYLMLSYNKFIFNGDTKISKIWSKKAFYDEENILPKCTELWTDPLNKINSQENISTFEATARLQNLDSWISNIVLPQILSDNHKQMFWADYQLWLIRSLVKNDFMDMARFRMLSLITSRKGFDLILQNQKSLALKVLIGHRLTSIALRLLKSNR